MAYSGKGIQSYLICVFRGVCVHFSEPQRGGTKEGTFNQLTGGARRCFRLWLWGILMTPSVPE